MSSFSTVTPTSSTRHLTGHHFAGHRKAYASGSSCQASPKGQQSAVRVSQSRQTTAVKKDGLMAYIEAMRASRPSPARERFLTEQHDI